jgi:predicted DNA-binding transcriptional regulator AlpA
LPPKDKSKNAALADFARAVKNTPMPAMQETATPIAGERCIDKTEVLRRVPLSYAKIWQLMREGRFPRSRALGTKVVWIEGEVDQYITSLPIRRLKGDDAPEAA